MINEIDKFYIITRPNVCQIMFLATTKQLYEWSVRLSVRLSVCLSVCSSHLFDYVPIIVSSWSFQELLPMTEVMFMQKVKVRGQRSRSHSKPNLAVSGPQLLFEFTYDDEMVYKVWWCLEEVPYCLSRSSVKFQGHAAKKNRQFWPKLSVSGL